MRSDESLRQEFLAAMRECEVVDTHSHTRFPDRYYAEGPYDLFSLNSYFERDIVGLLAKTPITAAPPMRKNGNACALLSIRGRTSLIGGTILSHSKNILISPTTM